MASGERGAAARDRLRAARTTAPEPRAAGPEPRASGPDGAEAQGRRPERAAPPRARPPLRLGLPVAAGHGLVLGVVLLLAAALRLAALDRFPPGLHYDEAAYGVLAVETLDRGDWRIFYRDFAGREPIFVWLSAAAIAVLGPTPLALRLVAALVGVLSVGATYLAGRALFGRWVGLAGAAAYAVTFWPVLVGRLGYRANLPPLFEALAVWLLWRALRPDTPGSPTIAERRPTGLAPFLLAGAAIGLVLYTYVAARFFYVALALFLLLALVTQRRWLLARWRGLAVAGLAALVVMAPLGAYFLQDPAAFTIRFDQTFQVRGAGPPGHPDGPHGLLGIPLPAAWASALDSGLKTLAAFSFAGDPLWKENLPGRPIFDPIGSALLYLGVLGALLQVRRPAALLLLCWGAALLLPGALTTGAPHFLRLVSAAPPVFLLVGLGAAGAARALAALLGRSPWRMLAAVAPRRSPASPASQPAVGVRIDRVVGLLFAAWTALTALQTTDAYFRRWGPHAETYFAQEGDVADAARAARDLVASGAGRVAFSAEHYRHPAVAYLAGPAYDALAWFDARFDVVVSPPGEPTTYVVPASARGALLERCLAGAAVVAQGSAPDGRLAFQALRWPGGQPTCRPAAPLGARLVGSPSGPGAAPGAPAGLVELIGYDRPAAGRPGETLELVLHWRVLGRPERPTEIFAHLVDARGRSWGSFDGIRYQFPEWRPGEVVVSRLPILVDVTAPPGEYRIEFGFYDRATLRRLARLDERGNPVGDTFQSDPIRLERAARPLAEAELPVRERVRGRFGDLELLGLTAERLAAPPGEPLRVGLFWRAAAPLPDLQLRLSLARAGQVVQEWVGPPVDGVYPTSAWAAGEVVRDERDLTLGPRVPPGPYDLLVQALDAAGRPLGDPVRLGGVTVEPRARLTERPSVARPQVAQFGTLARFLGYELGTGSDPRPGGHLDLTLYWQATGETDRRFKVFTHLTDRSERIWGQADAEPAGGAQPTSSWLAGEYVVDRYRIPIDPATPPGEYRIAIGLYDAAGGERLPLESGGNRLFLADPVTVR